MSDLVTVDVDGHVLLVGVNRPDKYNAFNLETIDAFAQAYERLGNDDDIRVGVVYGHGKHFSAGLDLAEVGAKVQAEGPGALRGDAQYDPYGLWGPPVDKPVVMAVQGIAYTLSIELALASDIVVAADDVRFRQLEIGRGIVPFGGATIRATQQLGWGNAMRFLLTAEEFGAQQAHHIGLVQDVVPPGEQLQRATEIAQTIARQAPLGVRATLANARLAQQEGLDAAREHLVEVLEQVLASEDAKEGVLSFLERRDAQFEGR